MKGSLVNLIGGIIFALSLFLLLPMSALTAQDAPQPVKIGVLAKRGPELCMEKWGATAEYLSSQIPGYSFTIVPLDYDEIYPVVERGEVDFIFSNPSFYVGLEHLYGARRLVTLKNLHLGEVFTAYGGVIFYRSGRTDIESLGDLKGKTFMAVEKRSFGGWQTAWREMKEKGIDPYRDFAELEFAGTHDAVVYAVLDGKVDAGTVRTDTLERMVLEGKIDPDEFRIIHEHDGEELHAPFLDSTRSYPEWPFAKVKHTSDELAEKVAVGLMMMSPDSQAAKVARCAGWTVPHNYQPVHECLKELCVSPYEDYGKVTPGDVFRTYWPWIISLLISIILISLFAVHVVRLNRRLHESMAGQRKELTERKRAEEKLRREQDFLQTLFETANAIILVLDTKGRVVSFNKYLEDISGYKLEEAKGENWLDTFIPERARERIRDIFSEITRDIDTSGNINPVMSRDGREIPVEWYNKPLKGPSGELIGTLSIGHDITERLQSEKAVRGSERFYRDALNDMLTFTVVLDVNGDVIFVNNTPLKLAGIELEDVVGKKFHDTFWWEYSEEARQAIKRDVERCASGETLVHEIEIKTADGSLMWIEFSMHPILDEDGKVKFLIPEGRDVTERKRAEEEKKHLEAQVRHVQKLESLGVLAGGIAHDFNNLLVGILGHADLAIVELDPESPARYYVEQVQTAAMRASELTNQMLAYSGKGRFVVEALNINKIIEEMVHLIEVSVAKNAALKLNLTENIPPIEADAAQVRQVILNLITNASDAVGDRSGIITITTGVIDADRSYLTSTFLDVGIAEGRYTYFEVSDTGVGMDAETMEKIFDPFFTTKFTGRGLGLAAVLGIIRGHAGAIKVYSEPGKGTTIKVLFPSSGLRYKLGDKDAGIRELRDWRGSGTILIVDDEESVRDVASLMLKRFGFDTLTARDGREALVVYEENIDDIVMVLLDMTMPRMGGEGTFTELRRINPDVRVLLCSGYNEQDATSHFTGKGLAGFIQKPFQLEKLLLKVYSVLKDEEGNSR